MRGSSMLSCLAHAFHYHKQCELNMCIAQWFLLLLLVVAVVLLLFWRCFFVLLLLLLVAAIDDFEAFFLVNVICTDAYEDITICLSVCLGRIIQRIYVYDPMCFSAKPFAAVPFWGPLEKLQPQKKRRITSLEIHTIRKQACIINTRSW